MRLALLICCAALAFTVSAKGQSDETDPYSINTVKFALTLRSKGQKIVFSKTQRALARLGDGVSVALIKILDDQKSGDPQTIEDFLAVIREAFDQPQLISIEVDRQPKLTLIFLSYLQQNVSDSQSRQDIQTTIEFVKGKTSK